MIEHKNIGGGDIHTPFNWVVADSTALAALAVAAEDIHKQAFQVDTNRVLTLLAVNPVIWQAETPRGATAWTPQNDGKLVVLVGNEFRTLSWQDLRTYLTPQICRAQGIQASQAQANGDPYKQVRWAASQFDGFTPAALEAASGALTGNLILPTGLYRVSARISCGLIPMNSSLWAAVTNRGPAGAGNTLLAEAPSSPVSGNGNKSFDSATLSTLVQLSAQTYLSVDWKYTSTGATSATLNTAATQSWIEVEKLSPGVS